MLRVAPHSVGSFSHFPPPSCPLCPYRNADVTDKGGWREEEGELKMLLVISKAVKLCQKYAAPSSFSAPLNSLWVCNCICYSFDGLEEPSRPWCTRYYSLLAPTALGPPKITAWSLLFKVSHQGEWGGGWREGWGQGSVERSREAERCLHCSPLRRSKWTPPSNLWHHNGLAESEREPSLLKML